MISVSGDSYFKVESKVADFLVDFRSIAPPNKQVVIVGITEEDYKTLFNSRSPLSPAAVTKIIDAISKGEPRVLGIDLLTPDEIHRTYLPRQSAFPIVWAEESMKNDANEIQSYKGPLGGQRLLEMNYAALPEVPVDPDGIHRLYQRTVRVREGDEKAHPTFAWRVYELARPEEAKLKEATDQEYYMRFAGRKQQDRRLTISASQLVNDLDKNNIDELKRFLKDKVVLLGGMFSDSRDRGAAPIGDIYGVEMNATIVETELYGQPRKSVSSKARMLINLVMMLALTTSFSYLGINRKSISIAVSAIIVLVGFFVIGRYGNLSGAAILLLVVFYGLFVVLFKLATDKYKEKLFSLFDRMAS